MQDPNTPQEDIQQEEVREENVSVAQNNENEQPKEQSGEACNQCQGTGLKDQNTICEECEGSGLK